MRLFVALPVPQDVRRTLRDATDPLREQHPGLRWTRPEGWHLTLAFLGAVPDEALAELRVVLGRSLAGARLPERLRIGEPGRFGRDVLYVTVVDEPAGALERLAGSVRGRLVDSGFPVDARRLRPHLTLARAGRGAAIPPELVGAGPGLGGAWPAAAGPDEAGPDEAGSADASRSWCPSTVELWSSHLGGGPARYEVEASVAVDGSG